MALRMAMSSAIGSAPVRRAPNAASPSRSSSAAKEATMTWLSLILILLTPALAHATLQAAVSLDGGLSLLACDQNLCAGGALPTFPDTNPTLGVLATDPVLIGLVSASFAVQTSIKGPLNTLSSSGTVIQNTDGVSHTLQLTLY